MHKGLNGFEIEEVKSQAREKPFVAINTSIPVDCQVFAAAHELYHI
ncbi:MAG: hypothetical protein K2K09_04010 [Lachnospiraceae bacterium]|nr:hypothetical protein [Lachnospiraceae bacterium]